MRTLLLHVESKSLLFSGDIFGTWYSRQKRDSLIIIREERKWYCICTILGFVKCTVIMNFVNRESVKQDFTLVKVVKNQRHFYAPPVQVFYKADCPY